MQNSPLATENNPLYCGHPAPDLLDYLQRRRSCPLKNMGEPGPGRAQVETILKAAARVPDHGKLFPWHFIVFDGPARAQAGALLAAAWKEENPQQAEPAKLELESGRFARAPLVIGVISRVREGKHPVWEQILSAGAACQNLCLAANALGFATNWLTEWYSYSPAFKAALGLDARDHVAGFIYIGTATGQPDERPRPDLSAITTWWQPGAALNKGAEYGQAGLGIPRAGFAIDGMD
jgi:nitroreductase